MTREEFLRRKMMFERGIFHEDPPKTEPTKPIKHTSIADNELLSFQEKVRMGKKYYADQMAEYFDVNAANEDNFRRMVENHAIIHGSVDPNNAVLAREVSKNAEQEYKDFKQKVKEGQQYVVNQKEEYIDINAINADNQRQMVEDHLVIHSGLSNSVTNSSKTAEQEYVEFRKKVKAAERHFSDLRNQEYLEHHGIIGQKWGVRRYQNTDGSLTEEGKQRYLNPDGSISDKAPIKIQSAYNRYLYQKERAAADSGESYKDNYYHSDEEIKSIVERAKKTDKYDMSFLEAIQNAESLDDYDYMKQEEKSDAEKEKIAELRLKEYAKYLKNPRKYMSEFDSQKFDKEHKNIGSKPSKEKIVGSEEKKEEKEESKGNFGPKATKEEEEKFWKELAKQLEKDGMVKSQNESSNEKKEPMRDMTSDERKAMKEARKEAYKSASKGHTARNILLGPLSASSDWALVNKAIKELGITSEQKKNMSASDWRAVNEKIKELRGTK